MGTYEGADLTNLERETIDIDIARKAKRNTIVGENGEIISDTNPLPISLSSDIQIGAVEIKDGETDTRLTVELDVLKNALFVRSESLASELTLSSIDTNITSLESKDFATETTLQAIQTNQTNATQVTKISDGTTEFQIDGFNIPVYDEIVLTYVTSGNGIGEIETVVYKKSSSTVGTLTLSYDANDKLSGVVKS